MRTNCIDCLDRTNALQTLMGVDALGFQLVLDLVLERLRYLERYGRFSPIPYAYAYTYVYALRKRVVENGYRYASQSTFDRIVYFIVYCRDFQTVGPGPKFGPLTDFFWAL